MKNIKFLEVVIFLLMFLFLYAAISKLMEYELFKAQIGKSPLVSRYAGLLAGLVPITELIISVLLFIPRFRLVGLYASFSLMLAFTAYIAFILAFSPYVPCSCGGILSRMGWTQHLIFNIGFTFLCLAGIANQLKQIKTSNTLSSPS